MHEILEYTYEKYGVEVANIVESMLMLAEKIGKENADKLFNDLMNDDTLGDMINQYGEENGI